VIGGLLSVADGTAIVYLNRITTDQLGGFGVSTKHTIGRALMAKQIADVFER
jgi:hypothetical protein